MDNARRKHINLFADVIRNAVSVNPPLEIKDLQSVIERLNGRYNTHDENQIGCEAFVRKLVGDVNDFEISISASKPESRMKFSIAHEIAHLFLHMGFMVDDDLWKKNVEYKDSVKFRYGYTEEELEANEFAGAFLMPEDKFREVASQNYDNDKYDLKKIADYFGVSSEAAKNRGRWLGIFSWS